MANYEATRYNFSGQDLVGVEGVNTGIIIPWSDTTPPSGFLECDGTAVSRSTYATLFAVVGTTYGVGDGSTTFNVPDLTDKVVVNKSPTKSLATTGGANTVALQGSVQLSAGNTTITTPTLGAHAHPWSPGTGVYGGDTNTTGGPDMSPGMGQNLWTNPAPVTFTYSTEGGGGAHGHPISGGTVTGVANSVLQPYLTLMYIIKT